MRPRARSPVPTACSEGVEVGVDELVAHEEGDHPAQREKGPERHSGLAPLRGSLARDDRRAEDHAGDERDEDGRGHRAPRYRPSTPASLTSPIPIPRGYSTAAMK